MRGATNVTLQPRQILRLPRKMTRMLDPRHIWNIIYNAPSNRCRPPTSRNIAPATQNDSHAWSSSQRKRHFTLHWRGNQCHPPTSPNTAPATQNDHPKSDRNLVKQLKRHLQCAADPRPIRPWPDHDPRPNPGQPATHRATELTFSRSQGAFCMQKYNISQLRGFSKFHQVLRLQREVELELFAKYCACHKKVTLELHQVLRLPPSTAPARKSGT